MSIGEIDLSKERSESSLVYFEDVIYLEHFYFLFVLSSDEIPIVALFDKIIQLFPHTFNLRVSPFQLCIYLNEADPDLHSGKEVEK